MAERKIPVGILGATGVVGQRFVQLLQHHPWFEVAWLAASDRSAGQPYKDAVRWKLRTPIPSAIADMVVSPASPEGAPKVIFAALDAAIAKAAETAGVPVALLTAEPGFFQACQTLKDEARS